MFSNARTNDALERIASALEKLAGIEHSEPLTEETEVLDLRDLIEEDKIGNPLISLEKRESEDRDKELHSQNTFIYAADDPLR